MASVDLDRLNATLANDPEWEALTQQLAAAQGQGGSVFSAPGKTRGLVEARKRMAAKLAPFGVPADLHDFNIDSRTGEVSKDSFLTRNMDWIIPLSLVGGGAAGAALAGGGAAAGGATSLLPTGGTATTLAPAVTTALAGGGTAGPILAGTGGGSSIWQQLAKLGSRGGEIADLTSALAAGRAEGRLAESQNAQDEDLLAMRRAELGIAAPRARAVQTALGDLLSNVQDVQLNVPGIAASTTVGGVRPSALGPNARQAGAELSKKALEALISGSDIPPPTERPQASGVDTGLNWASVIGTGFGAANRLFGAAPPGGGPNVPTPAPTNPHYNPDPNAMRLQIPKYTDPNYVGPTGPFKNLRLR